MPTLERAFEAGQVHLVAVPIDYSENTRVLIEELGNRAPELEPKTGGLKHARTVTADKHVGGT